MRVFLNRDSAFGSSLTTSSFRSDSPGDFNPELVTSGVTGLPGGRYCPDEVINGLDKSLRGSGGFIDVCEIIGVLR